MGILYRYKKGYDQETLRLIHINVANKNIPNTNLSYLPESPLLIPTTHIIANPKDISFKIIVCFMKSEDFRKIMLKIFNFVLNNVLLFDYRVDALYT